MKQLNINLQKRMWNCDKCYNGETGRPFIKRFKEHLPKKSQVQKSNFVDHLVNSNNKYMGLANNLKSIYIWQKCTQHNTQEHIPRK